jgi:hypothetical protein
MNIVAKIIGRGNIDAMECVRISRRIITRKSKWKIIREVRINRVKIVGIEG